MDINIVLGKVVPARIIEKYLPKDERDEAGYTPIVCIYAELKGSVEAHTDEYRGEGYHGITTREYDADELNAHSVSDTGLYGSDDGTGDHTERIDNGIGYAFFIPRGSWRLLWIVVEPAYQGQGVAARLMRAAAEGILEGGHSLITAGICGDPYGVWQGDDFLGRTGFELVSGFCRRITYNRNFLHKKALARELESQKSVFDPMIVSFKDFPYKNGGFLTAHARDIRSYQRYGLNEAGSFVCVRDGEIVAIVTSACKGENELFITDIIIPNEHRREIIPLVAYGLFYRCGHFDTISVNIRNKEIYKKILEVFGRPASDLEQREYILRL